MKKLTLIIGLVSTIVFTSCTGNQRAKNFGGNYTIELPSGQTLVTTTWKADNLWYLTRERKAGETPTTHIFNEDSSFGVIEGTVTFKEK